MSDIFLARVLIFTMGMLCSAISIFQARMAWWAFGEFFKLGALK